MAFSPDIIVLAEDAPRMLLIVETKLSPQDRSRDESQLKSYMLQMRCPVGLFVTPEEIVIFRDSYTAHSEQSVRRVGVFPAPKDWLVFKTPQTTHGTDLAWRFEENVKAWLERLRSSSADYVKEFPKETQEAVIEYVLPALAEGTVRAGGPREVKLESH
jgi:hypothetical protein